MAIITTGTLVVAGILTFIGASGSVLLALSEEDRLKEKVKQLQAENEQLNAAKNYVNNIKDKLTSSREYLINAKTDFKNGGHVHYDMPLAYKEFNGCINTLEGAMVNATKFIDDCNATIEKNINEINSLQNQIQAKKAASIEASKKQHERRGLTRTSTTSSTKKSNNTNKPKHR